MRSRLFEEPQVEDHGEAESQSQGFEAIEIAATFQMSSTDVPCSLESKHKEALA